MFHRLEFRHGAPLSAAAGLLAMLSWGAYSQAQPKPEPPGEPKSAKIRAQEAGAKLLRENRHSLEHRLPGASGRQVAPRAGASSGR